MVEFKFQPWKKIIVHEIVKFSLQHFLNEASLGVQQGGVGRLILWVDGIVFKTVPFRDSDDVIRQLLEGTLHWSAIKYAILEKYQPEFKVAGNIRIPVINVSDNEIFREMATWIKSNFEKKKE